MKRRYHFPGWAAMFLLSLSLFTACQQQDKTVKPSVEQTAKLSFLVETIDNADASEADRTKAGQLLMGLNFEEMESLIDLRHQYYLTRMDVDPARAAYLLDLRHKVNRTAFERKGKPFQQLDFADLEEVFELVKPSKKLPRYAASGRTAGGCVASEPICTPWVQRAEPGITNTYIPIQYSGTGVREVPGIYVGEFTYQCSLTSYQDDCDYVFRFLFSKLYAPAFWKHPNGIWPLVGGNVSINMLDNNPQRVDCGTYSMELMYSKTATDSYYLTPQLLLQQTTLVLNLSIQSRWCYTGSTDWKQWYSAGSYVAGLDGTPWHPSYPSCKCTVHGYTVY